MENKVLKVSLRVMAMFIVAILASKIPDLFPFFFGDWKCDGRYFIQYNEHGPDLYGPCDYGNNTHYSSLHWGYQHYLFFLMGLSLVIIQIVDIFNLINKK